jgi:dGTPase
MGKPEINMSPEVDRAMKGLRDFMFENVYNNPVAKSEEEKAINMITKRYEYYVRHLDALPKEFLIMMEEKGISEEQIICDYIAGMTDTYAVKKFQEIFVPESWKI